MEPTNPAQLMIPLARLRPGRNPREYFDPEEMSELEESVRESGVMQPLLVRPIEDSEDFEIVAGERRFRAAQAAGLAEVPALVKEMTDAQAEAAAIIENVQRASLSAAEEAKGAKRLLYRNKADKSETARQLGWSLDKLDRRLALTACTGPVLSALTERKIQLGHAELLAGVPPATQDSVLAGIIEHNVPVAVLKAQLGQFARRLAQAIFDTAQCTACPHNSAQQAGLFGESLGAGYCQHPTHYDELTQAALDAQAAKLKDEYAIVKIVRPEDGFEPLPVAAEGELGVGAEQYAACKGCASFGCAVSALPGAAGEVTGSLCFDSACHTKKVAARRKAERAQAGEGAAASAHTGEHYKPRPRASARKPHPSNETPPRVVDYRIKQWRKWAANALMAQPERNARVLVALVVSGHASSLRAAECLDAVARISGGKKPGTYDDFEATLAQIDALAAGHLPRMVQAVCAAGAFGIDEGALNVLLNYLEVQEEEHFRLDTVFLELLTKSQLESLAAELKLKDALGERFRKLREGKREAFIAGLLAIPGMDYRGLVPQAMRYPRQAVGRRGADADDSDGAEGDAEDIAGCADPEPSETA